MENIVKNGTQGYGYNYASLGDIAKQGFKIPKMKVCTDERTNEEYVWYYDETLQQWFQGAKVVHIANKSSNEAQNYGASLTYARRYTTLLYLGLACDDDCEIENTRADGTSKEEERRTLPKVEKANEFQITRIKELYDVPNIAKMLKYFKVEKLENLTSEQANVVIAKKEKASETN